MDYRQPDQDFSSASEENKSKNDEDAASATVENSGKAGGTNGEATESLNVNNSKVDSEEEGGDD